MCYCTRVLLVHYRTDDTCGAVHERHATTDRNTRALPTRGHARPRVHRADRRIANLCAHRSLGYSTRARWPHVGTPAHVGTVYGRSGLNLRARAGRYTTLLSFPFGPTRYNDVQRWFSSSRSHVQVLLCMSIKTDTLIITTVPVPVERLAKVKCFFLCIVEEL